MPKGIFVGVPTGKISPDPSFYEHLHALKVPDGCVVYPHRSIKSPYIANNQNKLVRFFLKKTKCEYFFLANDDQLYPPDLLCRLVAHDKDLVVPLCLEHELPCRPLIYHKRDGDWYFHKFVETSDRGLTPIVGSGGGGMLIKRHVLEAIADPWFDTHMSDPRSVGFDDGEDPDLQGPIMSTEDLDFCSKVIAAGFQMYCDLDTAVLHGTTFYVMPVRQANGQWATALLRNGRHVVIPMAVSPLAPDSKIVVPEFV